MQILDRFYPLKRISMQCFLPIGIREPTANQAKIPLKIQQFQKGNMKIHFKRIETSKKRQVNMEMANIKMRLDFKG